MATSLSVYAFATEVEIQSAGGFTRVKSADIPKRLVQEMLNRKQEWSYVWKMFFGEGGVMYRWRILPEQVDVVNLGELDARTISGTIQLGGGCYYGAMVIVDGGKFPIAGRGGEVGDALKALGFSVEVSE